MPHGESRKAGQRAELGLVHKKQSVNHGLLQTGARDPQRDIFHSYVIRATPAQRSQY